MIGLGRSYAKLVLVRLAPDNSSCIRVRRGEWVPIRRGGEGIRKHAKQFWKRAGGVPLEERRHAA